jgi:hypothetical protein
MPRINRVRRMVSAPQGMTLGQQWELLFSWVPSGEKGFETKAEYEAVWRRLREKLIFSLGAWRRPDAFWWVEVGSMPTAAEDEREQIIRLGELSPHERAELQKVEGY